MSLAQESRRGDIMTEREKALTVFEAVSNSWDAIIDGKRLSALRTAEKLKDGKITYNEYCDKIDREQMKVLHIFSFIIRMAFDLGISGSSDEFLKVAKKDKEFSDLIVDLQMLGDNFLRPTERAINKGVIKNP